METALDKFGRVLIPKKVRTELGLEAGVVFEIKKTGHAIRLQPVPETAPLEDKDGVLVFKGTLADDPEEAVKEFRRERIRKAAGCSKS